MPNPVDPNLLEEAVEYLRSLAGVRVWTTRHLRLTGRWWLSRASVIPAIPVYAESILSFAKERGFSPKGEEDATGASPEGERG